MGKSCSYLSSWTLGPGTGSLGIGLAPLWRITWRCQGTCGQALPLCQHLRRCEVYCQDDVVGKSRQAWILLANPLVPCLIRENSAASWFYLGACPLVITWERELVLLGFSLRCPSLHQGHLSSLPHMANQPLFPRAYHILGSEKLLRGTLCPPMRPLWATERVT